MYVYIYLCVCVCWGIFEFINNVCEVMYIRCCELMSGRCVRIYNREFEGGRVLVRWRKGGREKEE